MLYDFIIADKSDAQPLYRQIYRSIRSSIENGSLKKDSRLPSIRGLCESLGISKTTVIAAYDQLCAEGYIVNRPKKGYFVAADFQNRPSAVGISNYNSETENKYYLYDFSGKSIDEAILKTSVWKKEIKDIINRGYLLTSYGDVQGEQTLRVALQKYALGTRGVNTRAENIVVGAGTQMILCLLCSLLGTGRRVAMQGESFVQAEYVFKSFGYDVRCFESDADGVTVDSLDRIMPDILLINPNFSGNDGKTMPVSRRLEIISWADEHDALIIEDDYNGELRYSTFPMPCIQNYGTERTVYIGSFSKVLLPSVRISYMTLPEKLLGKFNEVKGCLNQTASKTEQLALASYILSGKIDAHIRKARRIYLEKSRVMLDSVKTCFPGSAMIFNETAMHVSVALPFAVGRSEIDDELELNSVRLSSSRHNDNELGFGFSGIPIDRIKEGVELIASIIEKNKACR